MAQNEDAAMDFDLDALQAEINMAMAETQAVVSSWVKPTNNVTSRPKKTFEEMEKELQEYLRRPPRLGVGHPIPEQIGPNAREEAKLKCKLVGNDKKRKRERDDVGENKPNGDVEEEEEESRKGESSSSAKISRPDPFSLPKKKAKRKDKAEGSAINGLPTTNGVSNSPRTNGASPRTQVTSPSTTLNGKTHHADNAPYMTIPASAKFAAIANGLMSPTRFKSGDKSRPMIGTSKTLDGKHGDVANDDVDMEDDGSTTEESTTTTSLSRFQPQSKLNGITKSPNPHSPTRPPASSTSLLLSMPLLNLNGPPASDDNIEDTLSAQSPSPNSPSSPSKKRRRRRKRKKRNVTEIKP